MTSIVPLLLVVLVTLPGCALWNAHRAAIDAAQHLPPAAETPQPRERWHESAVIEKDGNCELICHRYGNYTKCQEYRCP